MSNIIPFDSSDKLPSYANQYEGANNDLTQGVGPGYARLSIKGKTWALVRGDERTVLMNPKDPDSPASYIGVVIVKASPHLSRTFYEKGYEEGGSTGQPDCSSVDGIHPDAGVPSPQAKSCSACAHAVYGTGQNGKGFRCPNHRRLVVAKPGEYDEEQLMLLNVPGGSLKNLREFAKKLDARKVGYDMVLTKLTFEAEEATPKIVFTPMGFLPEEHYNSVKAAAGGATVQSILGAPEAVDMGTEDEPASGDVDDLAAARAEKEAKEKEAKKAAAAAKKKKEAEEAKAKAEAEAAAAEKAKKNDDLDDDLSSMLAEFDG